MHDSYSRVFKDGRLVYTTGTPPGQAKKQNGTKPGNSANAHNNQGKDDNSVKPIEVKASANADANTVKPI